MWLFQSLNWENYVDSTASHLLMIDWTSISKQFHWCDNLKTNINQAHVVCRKFFCGFVSNPSGTNQIKCFPDENLLLPQWRS